APHPRPRVERVLARQRDRREPDDEGRRRRALPHGRVERTCEAAGHVLAARLPSGQGRFVLDRKRGALIGRSVNGLVRLTAEQAWARIKWWATPIGTYVDVDGGPVNDPVQIPITERKPIAPA